MLIQVKTKCIKCGREYVKAAPYGTYHCARCNRLIGDICDNCAETAICSCGGRAIDKTAVAAAKGPILH